MKNLIAGIAVIACLGLLQSCGSSSDDTENDPQETITEENQTSNNCVSELPDDIASVDGYRQLALCDWQVFISDALYNDLLAPQVFDALASDINRVEEVLPVMAYEYLKNTNIWLELNVSAFPGGVYHPSAQWLSDNGYPEKWAKGIQFGNAQNYLSWTQQQPAMFLHELSHALHDQFYAFNQPDIEAAFAQAMQSGNYESVEYIDGGLQRAYATTNTTEYFAELTEAYYWTNDFYPFDRADLQEFDPVGLAAVELMWEMR